MSFNYKDIAKIAYKISKGKINYPIRKLYHKFHIYYYTDETLKILLNKCGFVVECTERKGIPLIKARGKKNEKMIVKALSIPEKIFQKEYELWLIARKSVW